MKKLIKSLVIASTIIFAGIAGSYEHALAGRLSGVYLGGYVITCTRMTKTCSALMTRMPIQPAIHLGPSGFVRSMLKVKDMV